MTQVTFIAQRELLFARKGEQRKSNLTVRVSAPYLVQRTRGGTTLDPGAAACEIAFDGLGIENIELHGIDTIHALAQAIDIDKYLRGFEGRLDFYWPTGEPYFDE